MSAINAAIELESKALLDNRIELKVPKGFELMKEDIMKLKYPTERRPTTVYTNSTGGINVALNLTTSKATQEVIPAYKDNFHQTFTKLYPSATWLSNGVQEINGRKVGYLEFVTPAVDTNIYNLIFFTDMDGKLLLCTFNCTEKDIAAWQPSAKEIMKSLKIK